MKGVIMWILDKLVSIMVDGISSLWFGTLDRLMDENYYKNNK